MGEVKHPTAPWRYSPWHIEEGPSAVYDAVGDLVCTTSSDKTAHLIAACVNACDGIPTEALEGGVIGDLVEALARMHENLGCDEPDCAICLCATATLAKAKGDQS